MKLSGRAYVLPAASDRCAVAGTYLGCAACGRLLRIQWATRSIVCSCGARVTPPPAREKRPDGRARPYRALSRSTPPSSPRCCSLVARDLLVHDPPRVLAWRLLHDERWPRCPAWLAPLLPAPRGASTAIPSRSLLGALAAAAGARLRGARALAGAVARCARRCSACGAPCWSWLPDASRFVAMGVAPGGRTARTAASCSSRSPSTGSSPGESPYGADYSDSMLGKQARVSDFWATHGGNPILRHHAYLPGTHLLMLPFYLARPRGLRRLRPALRDAARATLARAASRARLVRRAARRLAAAAVVLRQPARLLAADLRRQRPARRGAAPAGGVCSAERGRPVLARRAAGPGLRDQAARLAVRAVPARRSSSGARVVRATRRAASPGARCARRSLAAAAVFAAVVLPVAALDSARVLGRHRRLQRRPPRRRQLPARRHARASAFANFLIYFGARRVACATTSRSARFYLLLVPLGLLLLRAAAARRARRGRRARRRAAPRCSRRSTSRASCIRTT